jgi:hypothetical protein
MSEIRGRARWLSDARLMPGNAAAEARRDLMTKATQLLPYLGFARVTWRKPSQEDLAGTFARI